MHRSRLFAAGITAAAVLAAPGSASAAGGCALTGTANITPGLTTTTKAIGFGFTGKLGSCQGVGPKKGTVTATGSGTGSCSGNTTNGTATIRWANGKTSALNFSTSGTGVLVTVKGKITSGLNAGQQIKAYLLFYTASPQLCLTTGLPSASFAGPATIGA
jgi:hypothetical protein